MRAHSKGFIFHLDEVRYSGFPAREYALSGWCATPSLDSPSELWLAAGGVRSPCLVGEARPDVARHFSHPPLRESGFAGRVRVDSPATRLDFYASNEDGATPLLTLHRPTPFNNKDPDPNLYRDWWLPDQERKLFWPVEDLPQRVASLRDHPLISVLLPAFNSGPYHLHRCVLSVLHQNYPNWQLCISGHGSLDTRTVNAIAEIASTDRRISVASGDALERAEGEFVALLGPEDELHPYALLELARELNLHPEADLLYSDEDKIDETGLRSQPAFKPGFDPDMLLAFNYLGHLVCMRRSLALQAGGFRREHDGTQDWDLLLRATELTRPERVRHIAKPLYHGRFRETEYDTGAQRGSAQVLQSCLERRGIQAEVENGLVPGSMRVKRKTSDAGGVAVITHLEHGDQQQWFSRVRQPERTSFYELRFSNLYPLTPDETGALSGTALLTLADLPEQVVIFVNCPLDSMSHGAWEELASQCGRSDCGMVGGALVDQEGKVANGSLCAYEDFTLFDPFRGEPLRSPGYMGMFKMVRSVPSISPCFFAVPTRLLAEVGGLSSISSHSIGELCFRLAARCHEKGLKILFTPYAVATTRRGLRNLPPYPPAAPAPAALLLNCNLAVFPDPIHVLRAGL